MNEHDVDPDDLIWTSSSVGIDLTKGTAYQKLVAEEIEHYSKHTEHRRSQRGEATLTGLGSSVSIISRRTCSAETCPTRSLFRRSSFSCLVFWA